MKKKGVATEVIAVSRGVGPERPHCRASTAQQTSFARTITMAAQR